MGSFFLKQNHKEVSKCIRGKAVTFFDVKIESTHHPTYHFLDTPPFTILRLLCENLHFQVQGWDSDDLIPPFQFEFKELRVTCNLKFAEEVDSSLKRESKSPNFTSTAHLLISS